MCKLWTCFIKSTGSSKRLMPSISLHFTTRTGATGLQKPLGKPLPASPSADIYSGIKRKKLAKQSISDLVHKRAAQARAGPARSELPALVPPVSPTHTGGTSGKRICLQCRRCRKIPWRRKWNPTPVFLPGESHGQRSLAGYSPCLK